MNVTLLATDQQRSIIQAIGWRPACSIVYTPYGYHRKEIVLTCLLGFNGELPEARTGHYLLGNGYRAFNPVLMRFNSPDSLSPFGKGGVNAYAYCLGDPVNRSDESGRVSASWIAKASPAHIQSRRASIASTPWYEWSSRDIELVKHSTKTPFGISKLQPERLFGVQTSSKPFSPTPAVKPFRRLPEELLMAQPDDGGFNNTLMKNFYESRRAPTFSDEMKAFIKTPRAAQIEDHSNKFGYVMMDLKESFDAIARVGRFSSPSNIKLASTIIRNAK